MLEVVIPDIALSLALPEIGLAILVCAVLILDLFVSLENKSRVGVVAFVGVVIWGSSPSGNGARARERRSAASTWSTT